MCDLVLAKNVSLSKRPGHPALLSAKDVVVVSNGPFHLAVAVRHRLLRMNLVVAYVVRSDAKPEVVDRSRKEITDALEALPRGAPTILLADANGRVGSVRSCAVGDHMPDVEDVNGAFLHGLLLRYHLVLPGTDVEISRGDVGTWVASAFADKSHRIDYIAVSAGTVAVAEYFVDR